MLIFPSKNDQILNIVMSIKMNDYFNIGKITTSHGLNGEIVLQHALGKETDLKGLQTIFIEDKKDSFLPYFVESTSLKNADEVYVKLEGSDTKESVRIFLRKEVWILKSDFERYASKTSPISFLSYMIMYEGEEIGEVIEVIELPLQVFFKILYKGREALIPVHEKSLERIDIKKRQVHVNLPVGLLEL